MEHYSGLIDEIVNKNDIEASKDNSNILTCSKILKHGVKLEKYHIDSDTLAKRYSKEKGLYTIITLGDILFADKNVTNYYLKVIENELKEYINVKKEDSILVVGLGNEDIGADSLGSRVCKNIIVTSGVSSIKPKVACLMPNVLGVTGVESADIVYGVIAKTKPNKLIVIDSLCASASDRLARSIQITNTSIVPGGGVGNKRKKISTNAYVKDIVVIGVPLIIYASTYIKENVQLDSFIDIVLDTVKLKNDSSVYARLYKALKQNICTTSTHDVVTLKDIDLQVKDLSVILAKAINKVLHGIEDYSEI